MPTSYPANISVIAGAMEALDPRSCLDVGPGYGKYGFLFRERVDDFQWVRRLDGIDPFPGYMDRSEAKYLYNHFYQGCFPYAWQMIEGGVLVSTLIPGNYDLILMVDVLEHYEEADGHLALDEAARMAKNVLISTPLNYQQGPMYGNEYEAHRSSWPTYKLQEHGRWFPIGGGTPDSVIGVLRR